MRETRSENLLVKLWGEMPAQEMKEANPSITATTSQGPLRKKRTRVCAACEEVIV